MCRIIYCILIAGLLISCRKIRENAQEPELGSLQQGLKASAVVGYCASLAMNAFQGREMPGNVVLSLNNSDEFSRSWIMIVRINTAYPLQFNSGTGYLFIAGLGNEDGGVISMLFSDVDILEGNFDLGGIYTVPVIMQEDSSILTLFAEEDIVIGYGEDNLLNLSLHQPGFNAEMARLETEMPHDVFAAVHQNVWFIKIDQSATPSDVYDDDFVVNGGGQIAEVESNSGGIIYHAMLDSRFGYSLCPSNPVRGTAFSQNLKADDVMMPDVGNFVLDFHNACDGKVLVGAATGKYWSYSGRSIDLGF